MSPCNCGGQKAKTTTYEYTSPTGVKKTFRTEVEAKAAVIRNSGGVVKPVTK